MSTPEQIVQNMLNETVYICPCCGSRITDVKHAYSIYGFAHKDHLSPEYVSHSEARKKAAIERLNNQAPKVSIEQVEEQKAIKKLDDVLGKFLTK